MSILPDTYGETSPASIVLAKILNRPENEKIRKSVSRHMSRFNTELYDLKFSNMKYFLMSKLLHLYYMDTIELAKMKYNGEILSFVLNVMHKNYGRVFRYVNKQAIKEKQLYKLQSKEVNQ